MSSRLRLYTTYFALWLGFFELLRAVFLLAFADRSVSLPAGAVLGAFLHGWRLDLSAAAYLCLVPFLLLPFAGLRRLGGWPARLVILYTSLALALLSLLAAADLGVYQGWGHRIEASVLGYLTHPREVWAAAGAGPRGTLLLLWLALAGLAILLAGRVLRPRLAGLEPLGPSGIAAWSAAALLLIVPARGGLQLIPVNQSSAYFSGDRFANQAALNAGWNFVDSWRRGLNRTENPYRFTPDDSARAVVARARRSDSPGTDSAVLRSRRPSILLIVWESLPARAVEQLGGLAGVTPEFDRLAREGLLFRRFYAAGDRTEKGLAALLSGAPTIPHASILRVPSKTATLPMLTRDLAEAGYHTALYYGGELSFGSLKSFAVEGRVDRVRSKPDFPRSSWSSKWGAHDDAVADRLLAELATLPAPFFVTWLTLSSHEPFDVPGPVRVEGRDPESRFLNSLAYTDRVLGTLLRRAEAEDWWKHTLVIIVADHARTLERSDAAEPYKSARGWYHIPMLWAGGALARRGTVDEVGSQTDLAPTLLSVLGLPGRERYRFGRDLFRPAARPFAFYGFDEGFGLVTPSGSLVWEAARNRLSASAGAVTPQDLELGKAMLQLAYQDYLNR